MARRSPHVGRIRPPASWESAWARLRGPPAEVFADGAGREIDVRRWARRLRSAPALDLRASDLWRAHRSLSPWAIPGGTLSAAARACAASHLGQPVASLRGPASRGRTWEEHLAKIALMAAAGPGRLPPLLVDADHRLVDGCHRLVAHHLRGSRRVEARALPFSTGLGPSGRPPGGTSLRPAPRARRGW